MKKTVLTFGLLSGGISAAMLFATIPFSERLGFDKGEIIGYTLIVLTGLLILACASLATGAIPTWGSAAVLVTLVAARFLLGAGEAATFPVGSRAIRNWMPPSERKLTPPGHAPVSYQLPSCWSTTTSNTAT